MNEWKNEWVRGQILIKDNSQISYSAIREKGDVNQSYYDIQ